MQKRVNLGWEFRRKTRKQKTITVKKKERKHVLDQENKIREKTITNKKNKGRKWKTKI